MKRCDRCGGSGSISWGLFGGMGDCPECGGSGWVDPKVQGTAPIKPSPAAPAAPVELPSPASERRSKKRKR